MRSRWIQPDGTEEVHNCTDEPTLACMQRFVGGNIEIVNVLYEGKACHMVVHEEGMILKLPKNEVATEIYYAASRARGVEPTDPVSLKADKDRWTHELAESLGVPAENIKTLELGEGMENCIYGPAIVFDRRLS